MLFWRIRVQDEKQKRKRINLGHYNKRTSAVEVSYVFVSNTKSKEKKKKIRTKVRWRVVKQSDNWSERKKENSWYRLPSKKRNPSFEFTMDVIKTQQISSRPIEKVVVHPLVLLSIVDNYNRVAKDTRKRVVGVLLGSTFKGTVDVSNSYAGSDLFSFPTPHFYFLFSLFYSMPVVTICALILARQCIFPNLKKLCLFKFNWSMWRALRIFLRFVLHLNPEWTDIISELVRSSVNM